MSTNNVVFQLINTEPTTYQKSDGSFVDKPSMRKILMEYDGYVKVDGKAKLEKFRHIRTQKTFLADEQDANASFNPKRDNVFFLNGLLVVPETDAITIAALRAHKDNEENSDLYPNVRPVFKEVNHEKDAKIQLDEDRYRTKALGYIYELYDEKNEGIEIKDNVLFSVLCHVFNVPDGGDTVKLASLKSIAQSDPISFLFNIDKSTATLIDQVQTAISESVIEIDENQNAKFGEEVIAVLKGVKKDDINKIIIYNLVKDPISRALFEKINIAVKNKIIE